MRTGHGHRGSVPCWTSVSRAWRVGVLGLAGLCDAAAAQWLTIDAVSPTSQGLWAQGAHRPTPQGAMETQGLVLFGGRLVVPRTPRVFLAAIQFTGADTAQPVADISYAVARALERDRRRTEEVRCTLQLSRRGERIAPEGFQRLNERLAGTYRNDALGRRVGTPQIRQLPTGEAVMDLYFERVTGDLGAESQAEYEASEYRVHAVVSFYAFDQPDGFVGAMQTCTSSAAYQWNDALARSLVQSAAAQPVVMRR